MNCIYSSFLVGCPCADAKAAPSSCDVFVNWN